MKIDLNELEFDNIESWPLSVRIFTVAAICVVMLFFVYWFDIKMQLRKLDSFARQERDLRTTFERKQYKASNLGAYKEQMATMKESFGALLRQLPEKTEVPGLLEDISYQGLATGLEFRTIRLQSEKEIEFYVELPIEISVVGTYHQLAEFVSNVASLPRIVTLHDFVIRPLGSGSGEQAEQSDMLIMNITAKTYRYNSEGDL